MLVLVLVLPGCGKAPAIDATSGDTFTQSLSGLARTLPDQERQEFLSDVSLLAEAHGTKNLDIPTVEALVMLNGKTVAQIKELAEGMRAVRLRLDLLLKLNAAQRDLEVFNVQLAYEHKRKGALDELLRLRTLVKVSNVKMTPRPPNSFSPNLTFEAMSESTDWMEGREFEVDILHSNGGKETRTAIDLDSGSLCVRGRIFMPNEKGTVRCRVLIPYKEGATYSVRITKVRLYKYDEFFPTDEDQDHQVVLRRIAALDQHVFEKSKQIAAIEAELAAMPAEPKS